MYNLDQLLEHARQFAALHHIALKPTIERDLGARLRDNERVLEEANRVYTLQVQAHQPIPPSAEWLLDNIHIVREQIREIRQDLTLDFYLELPKLADGDSAGYPRIYPLALELLALGDGRFELETLVAYVEAFQSVAPLTLGELWAIPIMLRIGLVERLRVLVANSLARFNARQAADRWADRLMSAVRSRAEFAAALVELERSPALDPEFVVQLVQRLRDQDPALAPALQALDEMMLRAGADLEQYLRELNQRRSVNRISVGNVITSMRTLSAVDWPTFVEQLSLVERILERDPADLYAKMDFASRDRYRHVIEKLSKRARLPEVEVAERAVALAARADGEDARRAHVGYYLVERGRDELEAAIGYRPTLHERAVRWAFKHATLVYLGSIGVLTVAIILFVLGLVAQLDARGWVLALTALVMLLPASVLAVSAVNWTVTVEVKPHALPKLEFKHGIPPEHRTLVVVPALLSTQSGIEYLLDRLEQRFLTNRDENLYFALLTDFGDAPSQHRPEDEVLLDAATRGIQALNARYAPGTAEDSAESAGASGNRFFLLHRERRWNPVAGVWMGWERKRGKLIELNRLLRGADDTSYTTLIGDRALLREIKYVITLDADTELPLNTGRRMVGTLAHPLNRPVLDPETKRVTQGYGIIQPRVDVTAEAAAESRFSRIMTGDAGLDPYSSVTSDVYQDLFHTGVYIGKAIYDVDAMRATLGRRFPDNLLLSHDLLEGTYARTGLASDIVLLEDFPSGYDGFSQRLHRWTRGDWQITAWLWNRVPDASGNRIPNPLPLIERWKVFDNLRRSLIAPALVVLLVAGWTVLPGNPLAWTLLALVAMFFPLLRRVLGSLGARLAGEPWSDYALAIAHEVSGAARRAFVVFSFYLFQAAQNVHAIFIALWRRRFNPRLLLEWVSAADVERGQARTARDYWSRMWISPLLAVVLFVLVALVRPGSLWVAAPILALWVASPWLAAWVSQPLVVKPRPLSPEAQAALRVRAQQMWQFYAEFAGADDNWLPPDNFQIEPRHVVAHRTSPTNIGFLLLSIVAALDFKFIRVEEMADRVERVCDTLLKMERLNGHWYNWYDTVTLQPLYPRYVSTVDSGNLAAGLIVVKQALFEAAEQDTPISARLRALAECIDDMLREMDFGFLYSRDRDLFTIGYNVDANRRDPNFYDLLASEARLASYIAIAWGQVPERHWFKLGRPLMRLDGRVVLLSWGGTMFEYLLPTLFLPDFPYTLLNETYIGVIDRQTEYGREHRLPWGISESGYYTFDFQLNYQYRMFGVPNLSLKREFTDTLVVAPYATFLALPYTPQRAWENLQALERAGAADGYGFFEALDYSPARRPKDAAAGVVREYMAHHQGMSLAALDNALNDDAIRRRFFREPALAAIELLLQERIPQHTPVVQVPAGERPPLRPTPPAPTPDTRVYATPHTRTPRSHLLSNGEYMVMVTNAGGGTSRYRQLDVTRWREDLTTDDRGTFIYIQDLRARRTWSAAYQPTRVEPDDYRVRYTTGGVEFWRVDGDIETKTEIVVSPAANVELRQVTLTNRGSQARTLQLTSYAEVALAPHRADVAHPAFQKLFVESEHIPESNLLLFRRRPREPGSEPLWGLHLITASLPHSATGEFETDRMRFLGRGGSLAEPPALHARLSNTAGATLDPIMSLRARVRIAPGRSQSVTFVSGVAESRARALEVADEFNAPNIERAFELARVHSHILLQHLHITPGQAQLFQRLAARVWFPESAFRAPASILTRNTRGQSGLWAYGISGDFPIVLVRVEALQHLELVRELLLAHEFWRLNNFQVDLVILDEQPTSYAEGLRGAIENIISTSLSHPHLDKPGGVFVRRAEHMPSEDRVLLQTVARVILDGELGDLEHQLKRTAPREREEGVPLRGINPTEGPNPAPARGTPSLAIPPLTFANGLGGVHAEREYVIVLRDRQHTPLPWSNVLANPEGGALVTESGLGYSWAVNSQQNKLTPWSNDPVTDASGQIIYLQDDESGALWTPTPLPLCEAEPYVVYHGAGYTRYEHTSHELEQSLLVLVPPSDPVTIFRLTLRNTAPVKRRIRVTCYAEWVLGASRDETQHTIVTLRDTETQALMAQNSYNSDFARRTAFAALDKPVWSLTAARSEFLGRNGTTAQPDALLRRKRLSGAVGTGLDPCAVLQTMVELAPGAASQVTWLVGQGADAGDARRLVQHYTDSSNVVKAFERVTAFWDDLLGTIQVKTPDPALNFMLNRQLLYQTLACRLWGRSAFYQSGGAYGFRDQLQDVMALVNVAPPLARAHILHAASRQFVEGDVQHWWHPDASARAPRFPDSLREEAPQPLGKGVRTRISDDPLWLPFVVDHYLTVTSDLDILDEQIPFLEAPPLAENQQEAYGEPDVSQETATLYEHCVRALDYSLRFGEHGLPLMGTGDWNDGMNAVGAGGKGESVWLGWFLYANLVRFAPRVERYGDAARAERYRQQADTLQRALEEHGWDGAWYRRAYFDNGQPLGSAQNAECRIDAIAQAWAVISGAAAEERQRAALQAVEQQLVREQDKMILLLTPPFDHSDPSPGYIQGYVPGIRENGGQYTHGVLWVAWAYILQGNGDRAYELLRLLNPLEHARSPDEVARYQVEPYVIAADVYSHPEHVGRGGWTWYTGSAGWFYRIALEGLLGFQLRGDHFKIEPCLPRSWSSYQLRYRDGETRYEIEVENPAGVTRGVRAVYLDEVEQKDGRIARVKDGKLHRVRVVMG